MTVTSLQASRWGAIRESTLLYAYLLVVMPLFDMLTGYFVVSGRMEEGSLATPSQLGRLGALMMFSALLARHRVRLTWLYFVVPLVLVELAAGIIVQDPFGFATGVVNLYKLIYMSLLGAVLAYYLRDRAELQIFATYLAINVLFIAASIYFSVATGLGNSTYGWGFGTKGFFASGNGLGIYLGMSCLLLIALRKYGVAQWFGPLPAFFVMMSVVFVGTKTAFVLAVLIAAYLLASARRKYLWIAFCLGGVALGYEHLEKFLGSAFDVVLSRLSNASSFGEFAGSGRADYVRDAFSTFTARDANAFRLIFGSGAYLSYQQLGADVHFDTLESDFFDVLFMYGVYALGLFIYAVIRIGWLLRRHCSLMILFGFLFAHSILAGHVLFNGMSSAVVAMFYAIARAFDSMGRQPSVVKPVPVTA